MSTRISSSSSGIPGLVGNGTQRAGFPVIRPSRIAVAGHELRGARGSDGSNHRTAVAPASLTKRAGELAFAPRDVPHTYANHSDAPARALLVCTPAGFERYFARMQAERDGSEPPDWALQDYPETTVVGPQIGM